VPLVILRDPSGRFKTLTRHAPPRPADRSDEDRIARTPDGKSRGLIGRRMEEIVEVEPFATCTRAAEQAATSRSDPSFVGLAPAL